MTDQYKDEPRIKCCGKYPDPVQLGDQHFNRCKNCKLRTDSADTTIQAVNLWNQAQVARAFKQSPMSHDVKQHILSLYIQEGMTMGEIGTRFNTNRFRISNVLSQFEVYRERENERNREKTWEDRLDVD